MYKVSDWRGSPSGRPGGGPNGPETIRPALLVANGECKPTKEFSTPVAAVSTTAPKVVPLRP